MARGNRRESAWVDTADIETSRIDLLEGFLSRSELADCTEFSLEWLASTLGVSHSICLVRREGDTALTLAGSYGFESNPLGSFSVSIDDWRHPLIQILANRRHTLFPAVSGAATGRRRPATPFENNAFHVMPLRGEGGSDEAIGLLLWGGARRLTPDLEWFISVFALKLAQVVRRLALSEGDRKQEYER